MTTAAEYDVNSWPAFMESDACPDWACANLAVTGMWQAEIAVEHDKL